MTTGVTYDDFVSALEERKRVVYEYLYRDRYSTRFQPPHIRDAIYSYMDAGGKSLRPAVLLFACGAVGGEEERAVPVAAAPRPDPLAAVVPHALHGVEDLHRRAPAPAPLTLPTLPPAPPPPPPP